MYIPIPPWWGYVVSIDRVRERCQEMGKAFRNFTPCSQCEDMVYSLHKILLVEVFTWRLPFSLSPQGVGARTEEIESGIVSCNSPGPPSGLGRGVICLCRLLACILSSHFRIPLRIKRFLHRGHRRPASCFAPGDSRRSTRLPTPFLTTFLR
jgi:hypothetical protein